MFTTTEKEMYQTESIERFVSDIKRELHQPCVNTAHIEHQLDIIERMHKNLFKNYLSAMADFAEQVVEFNK